MQRLPYIANCLRWKNFVVADLNFNLLENFHSWTSCMAKAYCTSYFTGKVSQYQSIHENRETFPPQTICNIRYKIIIIVYADVCVKGDISDFALLSKCNFVMIKYPRKGWSIPHERVFKMDYENLVC